MSLESGLPGVSMNAQRKNAPQQQASSGTRRIGHCVIERKLGEGGMGVVYLARHLTLNKKVAVKLLRGDLPKDLRARDRFLKEARAAARLEHPNIVAIYDAGRQDHLDYIVMQYVDGESLADLLKGTPCIPVPRALRLIRDALLGVEHAHEAGVIHRDIKPDNILIGDDGRARLADFGLARLLEADPGLSQTGWFFGSPSFMSPEQALGEDLDHRTDLYSLGATLYQMITGVPPFRANNPMGIVYKVVQEPIKPPREVNRAVPKALSRLVCDLMAKDRTRRVQTTSEALARVEALIAAAPARGGRQLAVAAAVLASAAAIYAATQILPVGELAERFFSPDAAHATSAPAPQEDGTQAAKEADEFEEAE